MEKKVKITVSDRTSDRRKERKRNVKGGLERTGSGSKRGKMVIYRRSKWKKGEKKM